MKQFLLFLLSFSLLQAHAQVEKIINVPYTTAASPTFQALINLPSDYATAPTKKYPLLVFCHGDGEAGTNLSLIYNSLGSGGPAYFIEHGQWPASFTNPVTGAQEQFIVVSPQANAWGPNGDQLNNIVTYLVADYRVDINRIHLTGLSAGAAGVVEYASQLDPNETTVPSVGLDARNYPAASMVPMSQATYDPPQSWGNVAVANLTPCWGVGDTVNDIHGNETQDYTIVINKAKPGFARLTKFLTGHGPWNPFYVPTYTEKFTWNGVTANYSIYTWMLANVRAGSQPGNIPPVTTPPVTVPPITTPPAPPGKCAPGKKYLMVANNDTSVWQKAGSFAFNYQPGDTIVIPHNPTSLGYWAWVTFQGLNGAPGCPIVITGDNVAQTLIRGQVQIDGCINLKFTGSNLKTNKYGIKVEWDPQLRPQEKSGMIIFDRSKNIEVEDVDIHNAGTGIACLTDNNCDQTLDYPNWILDSMVIHDSRIIGIWNEGMYWGNTSPDNANYDWRADQCEVAQPATTYSLPMKNGYTHIYNMIIDSTGRGGIQLGNVGGTNAVSEINNNVVTHNGLSQDDAQGTAISIGLYTKAYIHDNTVRNTYTWGIASLGGCSTNVPVRVENNHIDSCGYLRGYPALSTTSKEVYDPRTEPQADDAIAWAYAIEIDTKPRIYTQASGGTVQAPPGAPYGTAVKGTDSTQFQILNNVIGHFKGGAPGGTQPQAIQIHDDHPGIQKSGNSICGNTSSIGGPITVLTSGTNINYSTCGVAATPPPPPPPVPVAPTVSAGPNQTVTLPIIGVNLVGSVIAGDTAKVAQTWSQVSGPNTPTIANVGQTAAIATGIVAGTYVFKLTATSKNGLSASATVTVVVNPAPVVTPPAKTIKSITITYSDGSQINLP